VKTIVEPKQHIAKLWGKQRVKPDATYRLMRYLLRVEHESHTLLHNVVTGQLVVLDEEEAKDLDNLPHPYTEVLEQLVIEHYLVPEEYDEHQQIINLRSLLKKIYDAQFNSAITHYTILPTTACNARCYYCFEQGTKPCTMTKETADAVVEFIARSCKDKIVQLMWFGGEPTIGSERIDQICNGLRLKNISYKSEMISNGYLFDETMVHKAKELWNLYSIQITVDGVKKNNDSIKAFVNVDGSPYERVMGNVRLLLEHEIHVGLRMNFDLNNYEDFPKLLDEVTKRFKPNGYLQVAAYPVIGEHPDAQQRICHGSDEWIQRKIVELNDLSREHSLRWYDTGLPCLDFKGCGACNNEFIVITPTGTLTRCVEQIGNEQGVGTIWDGITHSPLWHSWNVFGDYEKCRDCQYFPACAKLCNCSAGDRCYQQDRNQQFKHAVKLRYDSIRKDGDYHGV